MYVSAVELNVSVRALVLITKIQRNVQISKEKKKGKAKDMNKTKIEHRWISKTLTLKENKWKRSIRLKFHLKKIMTSSMNTLILFEYHQIL